MNKLIVITFFSYITFALADTISVNNRALRYKFNISKSRIELKGYLINLSLNKKKCNQGLFNSFYKDYLANTKSRVNSEQPGTYNIVMNEKKYSVPKETKFGRYLYNLPLKLQKAKKLENLNCKK